MMTPIAKTAGDRYGLKSAISIALNIDRGCCTASSASLVQECLGWGCCLLPPRHAQGMLYVQALGIALAHPPNPNLRCQPSSAADSSAFVTPVFVFAGGGG